MFVVCEGGYKIQITMRRIGLVILMLTLGIAAASAQKFAFVDTEYILNKIPAYKSAREQLDQLSRSYESEVDKGYASLDEKVKQFQSEQVLLTSERRAKKQQEIIDEEKKVKALQQKYFGRDGMLAKKQEELIRPIQDQVYNAVKAIASEEGYAAIIDVAASQSVLYSSPRYDKSDAVLAKLGYN